MSFTWISTNVAITATGSTAEISEANTNKCNISNSTPPKSGVKLKPHRVKPIKIVLKKVFTMANKRIVPKLLKNGLFSIKNELNLL